jgi:hypothetical protein
MRRAAMCYILSLLAVFLFTGVTGYAQALPGSESLAQLKKESRIFESIVEEVLKQHFNHPFALAGKPKAAYLEDYGVSVSFHLRINRGTIRTFSEEVRNPLVNAPGSKEGQVQIVRSAMIGTLADFGGTLKQLLDKDRIAICAHIEDRNELDTSNNMSLLVISVKKSDVEQFTTKTITLDEFKKRVEVLEY